MFFGCILASIIVQTQLLKGYITHDKSIQHEFDGVRVVFHLSKAKTKVPFLFEPLSNMTIVMDMGNQKLEEQELVANTNYTMLPNLANRISFFVKFDQLALLDAHYYSDTKQLIHLDLDVIKKLENTSTQQILKSHPELPKIVADYASQFLSKIFSGQLYTTLNSDTHFVSFNASFTPSLLKSTQLHKRFIEVDFPSHLYKRNMFMDGLKTFMNNTSHRVKKSLSSVVQFVISILGKTGIVVQRLFDVIRDVWNWDQVSRSHSVMTHLCKVIKDGIFEAIDFVDLKSFEHISDLDSAFNSNLLKTNVTISPEVAQTTKYAVNSHIDARSSYFEDLFVQNIHHSDIKIDIPPHIKELADSYMTNVNTTEFLVGFPALLSKMKTILLDSIPILEKISRISSLVWKTISHLGSFIYRDSMSTLVTLFRIGIKYLWNVCNTPIYIPIVTTLIRELFHVEIPTFLDAWLAMSAPMFSYTFYLHHGHFPLTDRDVAVLKSVESPYLLVWTWESDPLTGPPSKGGFYRKGCMIDWMTKAMTLSARLFSYTTGNIVKEQATIYAKIRLFTSATKSEESLKKYWKTGLKVDGVWAVVNMVFALNSFLSANLRFPYDYLSRNDPKLIREQMRKPDKDRWNYWIIRYPRIIFYMVRPILEFKYQRSNPMIVEIAKFLSGGMMKFLVIPYNIVDIYRSIDKKDSRRVTAWALSASYWSLSLLGSVVDIITVIHKDAYFKNKDSLIIFREFRHKNIIHSGVIKGIETFDELSDMLSNTLCFARYHVFVHSKMSGWFSPVIDVEF